MKNGNSEIFYNHLWRSHFPSLFCFGNGRIFIKKSQIITFQFFFWENLEMTLKPPNDTKIDENRGFRI